MGCCTQWPHSPASGASSAHVLLAGATGGALTGSPRCSSTRDTCPGSVTKAMMAIASPQRGHRTAPKNAKLPYRIALNSVFSRHRSRVLSRKGYNMNTRVEALVDEAKALSAEERVALLDALSELVSPPDVPWQEAWAKECEARLAAYDEGQIEAEDFDVVMARLRKEYLTQ